jgi:hypothetical protein
VIYRCVIPRAARRTPTNVGTPAPVIDVDVPRLAPLTPSETRSLSGEGEGTGEPEIANVEPAGASSEPPHEPIEVVDAPEVVTEPTAAVQSAPEPEPTPDDAQRLDGRKWGRGLFPIRQW